MVGERRLTPYKLLVYIVLLMCCFFVLYPLYYMVIVSISDGYAVSRGEVKFYPQGVNLEAYKAVFRYSTVPRSYLNSVIYTVMGTFISVTMTSLCAYPLSRKKMFGREVLTFFVAFTMFFDAGLVANYLVVRSLHMLNTLWAIVIPGAVNVWYMIIMRTFYGSISEEMYESAYIDGANDLQVYHKIVLPLSKAVIATMILFYAVNFWNSYIPPLLYLNSRTKFPMPLLLRNIVLGSDNISFSSTSVSSDLSVLGTNIRYAVIFITILPILLIYPFVQKYFVKGIMIGSIKG
ncbi:MAG: carbohydrate ABC transporter permease [Sphaerochaetaceae bacterium]